MCVKIDIICFIHVNCSASLKVFIFLLLYHQPSLTINFLWILTLMEGLLIWQSHWLIEWWICVEAFGFRPGFYVGKANATYNDPLSPHVKDAYKVDYFDWLSFWQNRSFVWLTPHSSGISSLVCPCHDLQNVFLRCSWMETWGLVGLHFGMFSQLSTQSQYSTSKVPISFKIASPFH